MSDRNFRDLLENKWSEGKFVCVGLDADVDKIPEAARVYKRNDDLDIYRTIIQFNRETILKTNDLVWGYKPNIAFYERYGATGLKTLAQTIHDIRYFARDVPVILDFKRGDIGNTNTGYCKLAFNYFGADAITINPYMGREANQPFLDYKDKGIFILCKTSNAGAGEFQDLLVDTPERSVELFKQVAWNVSTKWNDNNNCGLVVGATYPEELKEVREIVGGMPILIPGVGAQGGDLEATVKAGRNSKNQGMIINSSRGIIFASSGEDYAEAARCETQKLNDDINNILKNLEGNRNG